MTLRCGAATTDDLRGLIRTRHAAFVAAFDATAKRTSTERIHKTRVAARSLRSLLTTLKPLLRPAALADARRDLRDIAVAFEGRREADVRCSLLGELARSSGALVPGARRQLLVELDRERSAASERLGSYLGSPACQESLERLAESLQDPRLVHEQADPGVMVRKRLRKRWKRLRRLLRDRGDRLESLHELRLTVKHARYASETLMPLLGLDPRPTREQLKRLQDCLGKHRDATEALAWLNGLGKPLGPVLHHRLAAPLSRVQARCLHQLGKLADSFQMPELIASGGVSPPRDPVRRSPAAAGHARRSAGRRGASR